MKKESKIFEHSNCISEDMLVKYISNALSADQKHEVEKHLVDCEMCSDALEGLRIVGDPKKISSATAELNRKIIERAGRKEVKVVFLRQYRTQLAVAASIIVILGLVWFFRSTAPMQEMDSVSAEKMFADKFEPPPAEVLEEAPAAPAEQSETEQTVANDAAASSARSKEQRITSRAAEEGDENSVVAFTGEAKGNAIPVPQEPSMQNAAPAPVEEKSGALRDAKAKKDLKTSDDELAKEAVQKNKSEIESYRKDEDKKAAQPAYAVTSGPAYGATAPAPASKSYNWSPNSGTAAPSAETPAADKVTSSAATSATAGKKSRGKFSKSRARTSAYDGYESAAAPKAAEPDKRFEKAIPDSTSMAVTSEADLSVNEMQVKETGMSKYDKQDYAGAIVRFEEMLKKDPNDEQALFYSSVSYLSLGQPDKAITNLNKIMLNKNSKYFDDSQWYLSLAYIKKKDAQNARTNLTELKNNSRSKYQKQAEETLKELGK